MAALSVISTCFSVLKGKMVPYLRLYVILHLRTSMSWIHGWTGDARRRMLSGYPSTPRETTTLDSDFFMSSLPTELYDCRHAPGHLGMSLAELRRLQRPPHPNPSPTLKKTPMPKENFYPLSTQLKLVSNVPWTPSVNQPLKINSKQDWREPGAYEGSSAFRRHQIFPLRCNLRILCSNLISTFSLLAKQSKNICGRLYA